MMLNAFLKKYLLRSGEGHILFRREAWRDVGWCLTALYLQNEIYWSHRSPFTPWQPTVQDLLADDWEIVPPEERGIPVAPKEKPKKSRKR